MFLIMTPLFSHHKNNLDIMCLGIVIIVSRIFFSRESDSTTTKVRSSVCQSPKPHHCLKSFISPYHNIHHHLQHHTQHLTHHHNSTSQHNTTQHHNTKSQHNITTQHHIMTSPHNITTILLIIIHFIFYLSDF